MPDSDYEQWKKEQRERLATENDGSDASRESLRSIDRSLKTVKRIAIWFLVLSILGFLLGLLAATGAFR
jgi:hypothetical protein